MENVFELVPRYDSAKSFYGKARVEIVGNKRNLWSYSTLVAVADLDANTLTIKDIYSQTTSRHQREFARQFGFAVPRPLRAGVICK